MSVKAIKRFALGAKNGISTLNPFNDGQSEFHTPPQMITAMDEKCLALHENSSPPHQRASSSSTEFNRSSSDRDSPSRRRRLVGSLRNMNSMRRLRPLPQHQHVKQHTVGDNGHEVSCTSSPKTHTSLQLDFEKSPSDHPFFDFEKRKLSISSLIIRHSSPLPILASTPKENNASEAPGCISPSLPGGTVPSTPAPIQLMLKEDLKRRAVADSARSPMLSTVAHEDNLSTSLNGTHLSVDPQELGKVKLHIQEQRGPSDDTAGYFGIMFAGGQKPESQPQTQQKIEVLHGRTGLDSHLKSSSIVTGDDTSDVVTESAVQNHKCNAFSQNLGKSQNTGINLHEMTSADGSMDGECDLEDMKHLLYLDYCGVDVDAGKPRLCKRAFAKGSPADPLGPDTTQVGHADHRCVKTGSHTATDNNLNASAQKNQQSYGNIDYGKEGNSIQPTSHTAAELVVQALGRESTTASRVTSGRDSSEGCCDVACKPGIRNPSITSMEDETLEEVIRAYAAYDGDRAGSNDGTISNHVSDEVVAETGTCAELVHRMADQNAGCRAT